MPLFDLQVFIAAPSQEILNLAKMSEMLDIAAHYELTTVNKFMLKQKIIRKEYFDPIFG